MMPNRTHGRIRIATAAGVIAGTIVTSVWVRAQLSTDNRPLASLIPPGALLYLEAKDLHGLLDEWNNSAEKKLWLTSTNHDVLSRSRLLQRLEQAHDEFTDVAGIPIQMNLLDQMAGGRSAFAFYNLSALAFVYVTEMPADRIESTELWRTRARYQPRDVSGISFYVKSDEAGERTVAFASYKRFFVVATSEDLMAKTLVLLAGQNGASIANDTWFKDATSQSAGAGDLRLVYNLTALLATPQFRTYWIQRNRSELKPFRAGISDLFQAADSFEERRVLLRQSEAQPVTTDSSITEALSYASQSSSLYRAWSMPDRAVLAGALQQVIFGEDTAPAVYNPPAPTVSTEAGGVGSEADLEIRIDEPPFERASERTVGPLADALMSMQPVALVHVQTTAMLDDQVFVMPASGIVAVCKQPDRNRIERALAQTAGISQRASLDPLQVSLSGHAVMVSRLQLTPGQHAPLPQDVTYVAVYNHGAEWPHYKKLFAIVDRTPGSPEAPETPAFFSANVRSLGDSLSRLERASILSADGGTAVHETVRYELAHQ
ncbi:MAG: hypothetical protein JOZ62_18045 [Acidobacteriaceae bacterium]|nr:hypothetical protein [Acidobacteriaceae bacterium]